ncbi:MAG: murein L,D-transpeptidase family protein [Alphaproteobacteria bacterium]
MFMRLSKGAALLLTLALLAGCSLERREQISSRAAASTIPAETLAAMDTIGTDRNQPIVIRAFKKESEIEIWKRTRAGQYALLKTYPVCRWSGQLGPKTREGDRQVPEGFYTVTPGQMNPNSALWLSFNVGYPNAMERSLGRTGGDIMVHGTCSSRGCYAMTNDQMDEIYAVMREAFQGGQKAVQFQSYPFRMTAENLAKFRNDTNMPFWKNLKEGNDRFEVTKRDMAVDYCGTRYTFGATNAPGCGETVSDPDAAAVSAKMREDDAKVASLIAGGFNPVRMSYADGDQNIFFRDPAKKKILEKYAASGEFSRPEALAAVKEQKLDLKGNVIAETPAQALTDNANASGAAIGTATQASASTPKANASKSDPSFFEKWFGTTSSTSDADSIANTAPVPLPPPRG